jgi:para-nitrobenzyl esterase
MKPFTRLLAAVGSMLVLQGVFAASAHAQPVTIKNGVVEGTLNSATGIRSYKGIPFAAPPVGPLRWKAPQPAIDWDGVRSAAQFGPRCMQQPVFNDMVFRSNGMSEDCLYLNVWTPARSGKERLPVLVYFFGGGYLAGDGSEPRYDGESMAREGIVALTVNYRLNVFGFLAHPELTKESANHSSGNYALLDHVAALRWVRENIAAFGGDPSKVTIAGESAGSISVSALMASPLSKDLIAGAIGESGAMIKPTLPPAPLAEAEQQGQKFAESALAPTISALRAMSADDLLKAGGGRGTRFAATIDGWVLPRSPADAFETGRQARVPLLVGSNSAESSWRTILGSEPVTVENYKAALRRIHNDRVDEALKVYPASTVEEVYRSATELASDQFIAYSTWKWFDRHSRTSGKPVYYYFYAHPRPARAGGPGPGTAGPPAGAAHSAEIEYAMGNLATNTVYAWTKTDEHVSAMMRSYFANFIKTGDPNGKGLPQWPAARSGDAVQRMTIDANSRVETDTRRARYLFLESIYGK